MSKSLILPVSGKIPYEQVLMILEGEWKKEFAPSDVIGINEHCDNMIALVEACGWDTSDFIRRMMRYPDRS